MIITENYIKLKIPKNIFDKIFIEELGWKNSIYNNIYTYRKFSGIYTNELSRIIHHLNKHMQEIESSMDYSDWRDFNDNLLDIEDYIEECFKLNYIEFIKA